MTYEKVILITGGAGFIGSNFLNICANKYPNYFFVNLDCLTYSGNLSNLSIQDNSNYAFRNVDIRNNKDLEAVFKEFNITDIIHFAAETHVDISIQDPKIFIDTNIVGTSNLLELSVKYKINRFLNVSTDEVYGSLNKEDEPFTTNSNLKPNSPYSASKAGADLLVRSYNKTFGLDTVISRCTNNYGPHQDHSKLIPKFIEYLMEGKKVPLYANGENIRDWIYVEDHAEALDLIFHKGVSGSIYNIGANNEIANKDIVKRLLELTERDESFVGEAPDRWGHDFRYSVDTEELFKQLGFRAKTSFEDGIQKTFEFYKNKLNK